MAGHASKQIASTEDDLYAIAIVAKQQGLGSVDAAKVVAKLSDVGALVAAGRAGNVAECRKLLGL